MILSVKGTSEHLLLQIKNSGAAGSGSGRFAKEVFARTTGRNKNLSTISLAGLSTNLKNGMAWGLFPI